ncbi:MAG: hypothetical protein ABR999_03055 [Methanoregula sp.]|jgi:hypothetical protein|uniref:hypothetical protein n=1 Tax=Methanoregula sp. TaxID=2052170 RepID=UPI003D0A4185
MTDSYFKTLDTSSKSFLILAKDEKHATKRRSYSIAVMINSWVLLEAYINNLSEILSKAKIESHERALLLDRELKLKEDGTFTEIRSHSPTLKRTLFILRRFSSVDVEKFRECKEWQNVQKCESIRNDLIHPKTITKKYLEHQITVKKAEKFRSDVLSFIKVINKKVLNKDIILDQT